MMPKKIVILGAGLTGLSAAYHLQNGCCIYEEKKKIGGLACSYRGDGFIFDCDGHLFHFKTKYVKNLLKSLLPNKLVCHKRNAWIYSHDVYTKYPFQANTFGLPSPIIKKCILGMFQSKLKFRQTKLINFRDWMLEKFGEGITKYFMYPYNLKFWTIPPEKIISDWTQDYVPLVGIKEVIDGAFTDRTKALGYNSQFWYPKKGGIEQIAQAFAKKINRVETSYKVSAIDLQRKKIYFKNKETKNFSHLITTIPLLELKELIVDKLPAKVESAFSKLKFISIFNLNLGIDRAGISDKHWIYFPEGKFCFFRVGFPMNFSKNVAPGGKSSLYAEVSYSDFRPLNKNGIVKRILEDLRRAAILKKEDKILTQQINDIKYGYILYDHNYPASVSIINNFLLSHNIYPAGRYGRWKYMSMEDAILDGKFVSNLVNKNGA